MDMTKQEDILVPEMTSSNDKGPLRGSEGWKPIPSSELILERGRRRERNNNQLVVSLICVFVG